MKDVVVLMLWTPYPHAMRAARGAHRYMQEHYRFEVLLTRPDPAKIDRSLQGTPGHPA